MNIAVISDIHGNHYALKEVLKEAKAEDVEVLLVLGDLVGYYYYPEIVIDLLNEWNCFMIKGNHENILRQLENGQLDAVKVKKKYGSGHELALQKLDKDKLFYLYNLPESKIITLDGLSFQLNHGSPWDINYYLYPDSKSLDLERCNTFDAEFVLVGHSHYPFCYSCKACTLINCGSVGQSRQKGGVANWVLINSESRTYELKSTPYDIKDLLIEVYDIDPNIEYLAKILKR